MTTITIYLTCIHSITNYYVRVIYQLALFYFWLNNFLKSRNNINYKYGHYHLPILYSIRVKTSFHTEITTLRGIRTRIHLFYHSGMAILYWHIIRNVQNSWGIPYWRYVIPLGVWHIVIPQEVCSNQRRKN